MRGLNIFLASAVFAVSHSARGADYGSCKSRCEQYSKVTAKDYKPQPGDALIDPKDIPILQAHCDALNGMNDGFELQEAAATAMTAGAVVCGGLCAIQHASLGLSAGAAQIGCMVAGLGAIGVDTASSVNLLIQGKMFKSLVGGIGEGVGTAAELTGAYLYTFQGKRDPCVGALALGAFAMVKNFSAGKIKDSFDEECDTVNKLKIGGLVAKKDFRPDAPTADGGATGVASGGASAVSNFKSASSRVDSELSKFPGGIFAAATAGPEGKVFQSLNRDKIPESLAAMGMDLKGLRSRLKNQSPLDVLGSVGGLPDDVKSALNEIDKAAKEGTLTAQGMGGPTYASGGGGGKAGKKKDGSRFTLNFGGDSGSSGAKAPSDVSFGRAPAATSVAGEGDIWHSSLVNGSIFQIVSGKLNQANDRVEKLEWQTPLNRALNGLSNKR